MCLKQDLEGIVASMGIELLNTFTLCNYVGIDGVSKTLHSALLQYGHITGCCFAHLYLLVCIYTV